MSFEINTPHQYAYALMSGLYLCHGLGLESSLIWLCFSISCGVLAFKKS